MNIEPRDANFPGMVGFPGYYRRVGKLLSQPQVFFGQLIQAIGAVGQAARTVAL